MAALQFVPGIRARYMSYHRIAGKIINVLSLISAVSACGIARISFGGGLSVQSSLYVEGLMTMWSTAASWRAIRRLDVDQHRAWTIRAWSYQVSIVTLRVLLGLLMKITFAFGGFHATMGCDEVANLLNNTAVFVHDYPQCQPDWTGKPVTHVSIEAAKHNHIGVAAAMRAGFGTSMWLGLWINAVCTEYYLYKSKDESERLRKVSSKLQEIRRSKVGSGSGAVKSHLD